MSASTMNPQPSYLLTFYAPLRHTTPILTSIFQSTDAGTYPGDLYREAYWTTRGTGSFKPQPGANPNIGRVGATERVEEDKVEILCVGKSCVRLAVEVLRRVHPYEVVPYFVLKLEGGAGLELDLE